MADLETFRMEVREWLAENCPPTCQGKDSVLPEMIWGGRRQTWNHPDTKTWFDRLVAKGYTVPTWPKAYGGAGLTPAESKVLQEEMARIGTRSMLFNFGIAMLAPALMEFATEEQKVLHLNRIARGEIRWCQGYSEPGAGSDLASLRTRAVRDGDDYVVNGQKIWTSDANVSDWIFCLVRTDPDAPKHLGISFLLFDMESPGVSTSPIELISGSSPFCQTFFDDVRVPVSQRVHTENRGWDVAKALLLHERTMLADGGRGSAGPVRKSLLQVARDRLRAPAGRLPDAALREEIVQWEMDRICYEATLKRTMDAAKAGKGMGPEGSMFKLYLSEMGQRGSDLRQRIVGQEALVWSGDDTPADERQFTREWLYGKASTILGGTSEIQMNIISKRVLGLPGD
jgi:acyl-CoA dehydrogenase